MKIEQLSQEIKTAMLQKNSQRLTALRGIKSQIDLLKTSGNDVTNELILTTLQKMVKQRKESADIYKANGRDELFQTEMSEASIVEEFLPTQLSREEIETAVKSIITKVGATTARDLGKVMGLATKEFAGKADNKVVSEIAKTLLS